MTSLGETYKKRMKFIRFFVNRKIGPQDRTAHLVSIRGIRGFNGHVNKNGNMII